jgi:hypothetical protein
MSRRRRNQNRNHTSRNAQSAQAVNNSVSSSITSHNEMDEAPPAYQAEAIPVEPAPMYFENVPQVHIEKLPEQTSISLDHCTLKLHCRKWQFETIVDYPPHEHPAGNVFAAIFRIQCYSGEYNTIVAQFSKTITEFHVIRLAKRGTRMLWTSRYRVVLPDRPWPMDGLRAVNRDEYR